MAIIELTNAELLKDLTTLKAGETFFDLHNDYNCISGKVSLMEKIRLRYGNFFNGMFAHFFIDWLSFENVSIR